MPTDNLAASTTEYVTPMLPNIVADNIDRFTGRIWLLPELVKWLDDSNERVAVLTGAPGTGKSMVLAWLAGFGPTPLDPAARAQLDQVRKAVKAWHFCQASSRNITPKAFAENVSNQLTGSATGFADALAATLGDRVSIVVTATAAAVHAGGSVKGIGRIDLATLGDELSFDRAFTLPIKRLYNSGYQEPMLILVDALDEALGYTGDRTLLELLSTLSDLPSQVRILITTRNDPRVLAFFDDVEPLDLIKSAPANVDDVRNYAVGRLGNVSELPNAQLIEFAERIATQAHGVFLYAAMVLDELLPRLPHVPDLQTYPLPNGLSGLYRSFLRRELGTKDKGERWHRTYQPLLGLLGVAQGNGLTSTHLRVLVSEDAPEALDACMQYLSGEPPDGPFRLFHKSFADFLLEDKNNKRYHIDAVSMHTRLADHYWKQYEEARRGDWSLCDSYGVANIAVHLASSNQLDRLVQLMEHVSYCRAVALQLRDGQRIGAVLEAALNLLPVELQRRSIRIAHFSGPIKPFNWQANNVYSFSQCLAKVFGPETHEDAGSRPHYDDATVCTDCSEKALVHNCYWDEGFWGTDEVYWHYVLCMNCFKSYFARNTVTEGRVVWNPEKNCYVEGDWP